MSNSEKLAACPLCGDPMKRSALSFWHVAGTDSGCPLARVSFPNEDIPKWNTRPTPSGEMVKLTARLFCRRRPLRLWWLP